MHDFNGDAKCKLYVLIIWNYNRNVGAFRKYNVRTFLLEGVGVNTDVNCFAITGASIHSFVPHIAISFEA